MPALSLDHYNIYCNDLEATVRFYERYVGLTNGDRPPFPFPGAGGPGAGGTPGTGAGPGEGGKKP